MADTARSWSSLQSLLADNTSGDISAQDVRDATLSALTRALETGSDITLDWSHSIVNVDSSGGTRTITLPDNATYDSKSYLIRREGSNAVSINRAGTDTFSDGNTSKSLNSDAAAIAIFSIGDGEWKIVATEGTVA